MGAVSFALRFTLIAAVLFFIYAFPYASYGIRDRFFEGYLAAYAQMVGAFLRLFEPSLTVAGDTISGAVSLRIVRTCDAMEATILFGSALAAFPGVLLRKLIAIVAGLTALTALNLLRIASLYYVLLEHPRAFEFLHLELWPLVLILAAGALFVLGVRFLRVESKAADGAPASA